MKVKKVLLSMTVIILMLMLLIPTVTVYAEPREPLNPPIKLKLYAANVDGDGYAIRHKVGNEQEPSKAIWDIRLQSGSSAEFDPNSRVFCLNAWNGFAQGEDTYNYYYDMKKDEASVKALSSMAGTIKNTESADHSQILIYNAILALGDMVYIPGKSTDADKEALLNKVIELSKNNDDYSYGNPYWNQMAQNPLTDYEIYSVEQAVFWYFSNYYKNGSNEREIKFDNIDNPGWLFYNNYNTYPGGNHYTQFSEIQPVRNAQAYVLYKYLINSAIENAKGYSTDTGAPATVATTQLDYIESGDNYIIGPIRINEKAKTIVPYTIDFAVKNDGTVVGNPTLLNSSNPNDRVPGTKTVKDLVGQDFYILMPKSAVTHLTVDFDIKYTASTLILWTHSTAESDRQPVLVPKKYSNSVQTQLTLNPESKPFDLALRKYITKVNGVDVTNTRVPNIDETTLASGTTATYKHRKDPYTIQTGDIVTYDITIYNEGQKDGRATKIVDQLPTGLKFKRVVSGNFNADSTYSEDGDNKLILNRKANDTTNLPAYTTGKPASETITIECEVTAEPDTTNAKILTNIAWISEAFDAVDGRPYSGSDIGYDRDSAPGVHPNYNKDNMSNYKGYSENKGNLSDSAYFYKGEQDDDDFEKLKIEPETFDLKLLKNLTKVNGTAVTERIKSIDVSKLNTTTNAKTTADYKLDKNPVSVAKGDIVTYRLRVYNEGTLDGYASEITEDIPEGLEFIFVPEGTEASDEEKAASDFNMENGWSYVDSTDEGLRKIKTTKLALYPEINGEPDSQAHTDNLITAFGRNDGTKTSDNLDYKEVFVKMKVVSDNLTGIIIRNEACISNDSDKYGNEIDDRDSTPEEWKKEDSEESYDDDGIWKKYKEDDEDYDNIILKPFDLALRKFIVAVSDDETIENNEWLKQNGKYTRQPDVDTTKLNTVDSTTGKIITTATYNHLKEPIEVKKGDVVVYMLRVYNEGDIAGYATEIKDHLPSNLEYVDGEFNEEYGWSISEDGRTATTSYLENELIRAIQPIDGGTQAYSLAYKEVPIMCRVKDTAKVDEKITNIADITEFKDENKQAVVDRDSQEDNVDVTEGNKPEYKDTEINREDEYIPGQQDDDDFEKVVIPRFDLALRKQITSIYNNFNKKETKYNDRYAKLDNTQNNTIYNYYDVDSNKPTVVENDIVTYSIRVYNEGKVDGTATWVTDRLPSGLQYLPDDETNKEYGWKAYKQSTASSEKAVKIGEKYYEEVDFNSDEIYMYATDYLKDTTIKAYTGDEEATYGEVFMTTRVKAKSEVAEGTEFKLRNIAEIGDDDNDDVDSIPGDESKWKDQDDVDVEDLKLVEFDLALRKWVTQAIVIDSKGQTVTETGHQPYDDPEQVVKVELHRKKLNEVTVKFRYSIRIINEGDIAGYAKEITDYIPQGLVFVQEDNKGWTDEGNNVISTRLLEGTLLQPGEFADVDVILTWENSQDNMGVMVNTAEISEDYNEYGVPDRDSTPDNKKWGEDDIDDAPVMLSISTGQMRIYFVLGFVVLITIAGGVVLIKKYVL